MLRLAACLEEHFPHSMANAVVARSPAARPDTTRRCHSQVQYLVAHGIASTVEGEKVIIGSYPLCVRGRAVHGSRRGAGEV